jgi:hypothetical protein
MNKKLVRRVLALGASLTVLFLASCSQLGMGFTKIGDLLVNPQKYSGQEVHARGRVTKVFKLPFVATKIYSIRDDSGEINVRTEREARRWLGQPKFTSKASWTMSRRLAARM